MLEYQKWFPEARYGMFVHWGLYSILGRSEWAMYSEGIPKAEYRDLAAKFNPENFSPVTWAKQARRAGMKYMVMTSKHHDGFCLFNSKYTDFSSAKTASGRDFVSEYVEACRAENLKVGLYFSCKDWQFPAYFRGPEKDPQGWAEFITYYQNQVKELCSNYGKIDILWFDGGDAPFFRGGFPYSSHVWNAAELETWIRKAQPGILINPRAGMHYDFETPEKQGYSTCGPSSILKELCETFGEGWGFRPKDTCRTLHDTFTLIRDAATNGQNLLLNVSPDPNGVIPESQQNVLNAIGSWLNVNGEAFYGTERILPDWHEYIGGVGKIATKGNLAYLFITSAYPADGRITFWQLENTVRHASVLATGETLNVRKEGLRTIIEGLPASPSEHICTVIKLELDGKAKPVENPDSIFNQD